MVEIKYGLFSRTYACLCVCVCVCDGRMSHLEKLGTGPGAQGGEHEAHAHGSSAGLWAGEEPVWQWGTPAEVEGPKTGTGMQLQQVAQRQQAHAAQVQEAHLMV